MAGAMDADAGRTAPKVANQYDRGYDYTAYWGEREYEDGADQMAVRRLLAGRRFRHGADIGGGFGRLCPLLREYADRVTLAEPSLTQLAAARQFLAGTDVEQVHTQADHLCFDDGSLDLVAMVRVMHHLPDPRAEFAEFHRVLAPGGCLILEVANYGHLLNRFEHWQRRQPLPVEPVNIRTSTEHGEASIAFVNHNIATVTSQLREAGFRFEQKVSVSNLRNERLKRVVPVRVMLGVEWAVQRPLARFDFGPSVVLRLSRR